MSERKDEEHYLRAVEERFRRLRGRPLLLSPADFRRAQSWWRRGVPLFLVLEAIDGLFARAHEAGKRGPRSLGYCEPAVMEAFEEFKEVRAGGRPEGASAERAPEGEASAGESSHTPSALDEARVSLRASDAPEELVAEILGELDRWERGEGEVRDAPASLDRRLVAACLASMADEERRAVETRAEADVAPYREGMSPVVAERAFERAVARRVRDRWRLPDLSLLPLSRGPLR